MIECERHGQRGEHDRQQEERSAEAHDARQLALCLPRLMELAVELDTATRQDLIDAVEAVWEMYFPLGEQFDLAHGIAGLLYAMQDYERALLFYER